MRFIIRNYFFVESFETKKHLLLAQVNQILEFALRKSSIEHYYSDGDIIKLENKEAQTVAYNERKRRMQKYRKRANSYVED